MQGKAFQVIDKFSVQLEKFTKRGNRMEDNLFSTRLRNARKIQNLTQAELAAMADVTRVSINKYEQGESLPNVDILRALSKALQVSSDWLIGIRNG